MEFKTGDKISVGDTRLTITGKFSTFNMEYYEVDYNGLKTVFRKEVIDASAVLVKSARPEFEF